MSSPGAAACLGKLTISAGEPLDYRLQPFNLPLNALLGGRLTLRPTGRIFCTACTRETRRSYAQGHCFRCFKRLARCDLCVLAPHRCHFAEGTCREPEWGESFCMQPHVVYLSNTTGPKVGITRHGGELARWADQGAASGRVLATASTRQAAGNLEVELAAHFSDRAQWRALLSGHPAAVDHIELAVEARERVPQPPVGTEYLPDAPVHQLYYPVHQWAPLTRLKLQATQAVGGLLLGMKGQYLLFDSGVFNVREHTGFELTIDALPARSPLAAQRVPEPATDAIIASTSQLELTL